MLEVKLPSGFEEMVKRFDFNRNQTIAALGLMTLAEMHIDCLEGEAERYLIAARSDISKGRRPDQPVPYPTYHSRTRNKKWIGAGAYRRGVLDKIKYLMAGLGFHAESPIGEYGVEVVEDLDKRHSEARMKMANAVKDAKRMWRERECN